MAKKKSKEQKPKEKTYKIKVPVYTTSMLDQSVGLFEDVTYDDMIRFVKDKIAKYAFPLASPTRDKTLMTVIKNITVEEVLLGAKKHCFYKFLPMTLISMMAILRERRR